MDRSDLVSVNTVRILTLVLYVLGIGGGIYLLSGVDTGQGQNPPGTGLVLLVPIASGLLVGCIHAITVTVAAISCADHGTLDTARRIEGAIGAAYLVAMVTTALLFRTRMPDALGFSAAVLLGAVLLLPLATVNVLRQSVMAG